MNGSTLTSREALLALLRREPGLHLREIPRRLGLSLSSARYHLAVLATDDSVVALRVGRFMRWFPRDRVAPEDLQLISVLRVRRQRDLVFCLLERGPSRFSEIRAAMGFSSSGLAEDLRRLLAQGLVAVHDGPRYELADPAFVRLQLARYRSRFPDLLADVARDLFDP